MVRVANERKSCDVKILSTTHLIHSIVSRIKITQIKVLYNFRGSQSKLLNFKEQKNQNDQIAIYN